MATEYAMSELRRIAPNTRGTSERAVPNVEVIVNPVYRVATIGNGSIDRFVQKNANTMMSGRVQKKAASGGEPGMAMMVHEQIAAMITPQKVSAGLLS